MKKIIVVILNFNTYEQTVNMVNSVKKNHNVFSKIIIIIVDNASTDGSGDKLRRMYTKDRKVIVLKSRVNNGFASGNNIGYQYGKKMDPDFIIFSNSDVVIKGKNFFDSIIEIYDHEQFAVLGPDVFNPNTNIHQSPLYFNRKIDRKYILRRRTLLKLIQIKNVVQLFCPKTIGNVIKKNKLKNEKRRKYSMSHDNVALHGAFLIFSKKYIEKFSMGICDATFMYGEEDIILYFCQVNNLKTMYSPKIKVWHFEGQSTKKVMNDVYKAEKFKEKNMKKSMLILQSYIKCGMKQW
ncbi:glycosyltransferase [Lactiplantibacillus plantarum]|nr:glycosyltransferase [Lactiplantibacillus plantarum]